jgi:hypothetical protein
LPLILQNADLIIIIAAVIIVGIRNIDFYFLLRSADWQIFAKSDAWWES